MINPMYNAMMATQAQQEQMGYYHPMQAADDQSQPSPSDLLNAFLGARNEKLKRQGAKDAAEVANIQSDGFAAV